MFILARILKFIKMRRILYSGAILIFNGIERFSIEKIRINNEYSILGGITQAEIISFCLRWIYWNSK